MLTGACGPLGALHMTAQTHRPDNHPRAGSVTPFLKWAGGKRWFAERADDFAPPEFTRYVEPFLGSAALFFALQPGQAVLSDLNCDLIDCYKAMSSNPDRVAAALRRHHELHSRSHYYDTRATKPADIVDRAARFIYMNRTCWNGLYRVNRRNEFNVPMGTKTKVVFASDDFDRISGMLKRATLLCSDFEAVLDDCGAGDFVFVDPPYTVRHNMNGFLKYNDKIFSWADQVRLRDAILRASERGASAVVTNANHQSIRDLYAGIGKQSILQRASVLAANPAHRSRTEELVIRAWM